MIIKLIARGVYLFVAATTALASTPKKFVDAVTNEVQAIYDRKQQKEGVAVFRRCSCCGQLHYKGQELSTMERDGNNDRRTKENL
jgi:uncharacterized protein with PIN domain